MTIAPSCSRNRSATWLALLPWRAPISASTLLRDARPLRDRTVSRDRQAVSAAGGARRGLIDERVPFDLVVDQRLGRESHRFVHERRREIRHADVAGKPRLFILHNAGIVSRQRNTRIGPVDQQQVDVCELELDQALLGGVLEIARRQMR